MHGRTSDLTEFMLERVWKIIPAICTPCFAWDFALIRLIQPAALPSFRQNLPQIVTYILQKAFFKHALGTYKSILKKRHSNKDIQQSSLLWRFPLCEYKNRIIKTVRSALYAYQQTLPLQLARTRHPHGTQERLLSAAPFPTWHGSEVPVARDPIVNTTYKGQLHQ